MKWMDRPSVTKINRGGVYEMDRQTKFQQNLNATEMVKKKKKFQVLECGFTFDLFQ